MRSINRIKKQAKKLYPKLYNYIRESYRLLMHQFRKSVPKEKYPYYVCKKYKEVYSEDIDLNNPKKYSEKMQWIKLYDNSEKKTELTDKVEVRNWISEVIGEKYLVPIIGVYDDVEEIDFSTLPNRYVIKMSHGSGWNILVKNKEYADIKKIKRRIKRWSKLNYAYWNVFEIHYAPIRPRVIIEEYLEDTNGCLFDYKFMCFDGQVKYFWIDFDRNTSHKRNVYDLKWNLQPWNQSDYGNYEGNIYIPRNFDEMCAVAEKLCQGFIHVRVDLYNVDGRVYFGEMTFTNGSGYEGIFPREYENAIGELIHLPIEGRDK